MASPASAAPAGVDTWSCFLGDEGRLGRLYLDAFLVAGEDRSRFTADWYTPEDRHNILQLNLKWEGEVRQSAPTDDGLRATFFVGEGVVPQGRTARIEIRRRPGQLLVVGDYSQQLDHHSVVIAAGLLRTMLDGGDMVARVVDDLGLELGRMRVSRAVMRGPAQMYAGLRSRWEAMNADPRQNCLYTGPNAF